MTKGARLLLIVITTLFLLGIYNISGFSIPPETVRFKKSQEYIADSGKLYNLPEFSANGPGRGALSSNNEIMVLDDTVSSFETMLALIDSATTSINIETFILRDDTSGKRFGESLVKKAGEGVTVRLIYDSLGCFLTSGRFFNELEKQGVKVVEFDPVVKSLAKGRLDNRMHSKIIVVDGKQAIIGDQNFGDEYLGQDPEIGHWKGQNIVFKGSAVNSIQQVFFKDWFIACGEKVMDENEYPLPSNASNRVVSVVFGEPNNRASNINNMDCGLANSATSQLHIETPYFLPDKEFLKSLENAARRGVDVHLIIPARSDYRIDEWARAYYLRKLLQQGIKISTYDRGYLHAKCMIVDGSIAVVGSANLDKRSSFKDYETDALIYDKEIASQLESVFYNDLACSSSITYDSLAGSFFVRLLRMIAAAFLSIV